MVDFEEVIHEEAEEAFKNHVVHHVVNDVQVHFFGLLRKCPYVCNLRVLSLLVIVVLQHAEEVIAVFNPVIHLLLAPAEDHKDENEL